MRAFQVHLSHTGGRSISDNAPLGWAALHHERIGGANFVLTDPEYRRAPPCSRESQFNPIDVAG
jgi:hypothetical protein